MSVNYSVVSRKNPMSPDSPKKFYAQAQAAGTLDFETICQTIADRGTCIKGDVMAAIDGLIYSMKQGLSQGRIIRLGEFGSFQIAVGSYPAVSEKDFHMGLIKKARIVFRPGKLLTDMVKVLGFSQVAKLPVKEKVEKV